MNARTGTQMQPSFLGITDSMGDATEILKRVDEKGVTLWAESGRLHYRAAKGVLTDAEREGLRRFRSEILELLDQQARDSSGSPERVICRRAPLTFSQLAHWNLYRLSERPAVRQIACAVRLVGRVNVDALRTSIKDVTRRHDILRMRIVLVDNNPMQEIDQEGEVEFELDDLTAIPETQRTAAILRIISRHIMAPIDVTAGPLFGARLVALGKTEHILIVAMEHLISDAYSMGVLLRDLFAAYMQRLQGRACNLPSPLIQFPDYAVAQSAALRSWKVRHGHYWDERMAGCRRVRFPEHSPPRISSARGKGTIPVHIGKELKAQLREWCRQRRTTIPLSVCTAYVGLVLRWCGVNDSVIRYQTDGRTAPEMENAIGYFASELLLRVSLDDEDTFLDLLSRLTEEYCAAHVHSDASYFAAQVPRPAFTRNSLYNWVPQETMLDLSELEGSEHELSCLSVPFEHPLVKKMETDLEPGILLFDGIEDITGGIHFPLERFSVETMQRFGRSFTHFVEALVREPWRRVKTLSLCD